MCTIVAYKCLYHIYHFKFFIQEQVTEKRKKSWKVKYGIIVSVRDFIKPRHREYAQRGQTSSRTVKPKKKNVSGPTCLESYSCLIQVFGTNCLLVFYCTKLYLVLVSSLAFQGFFPEQRYMMPDLEWKSGRVLPM